MDPAERVTVLEEMARGREALREAVSGLDEESAVVRPGEGRWSVLECVEHLASVEEYLLREMETASPSETAVGSDARARRMAERAQDRSRPVTAPEPARPQGRYATLGEALEAFEKSRARTVRFIETCEADPRTLVGAHPLVGPINCYETMLMMALHPVRHAEQIREIRAAL